MAAPPAGARDAAALVVALGTGSAHGTVREDDLLGRIVMASAFTRAMKVLAEIAVVVRVRFLNPQWVIYRESLSHVITADHQIGEGRADDSTTHGIAFT
jgi:hypothetical protein